MEDLQTVLTSRLKFPKPVEVYKLLDFFGKNVLTSESAGWKRHRKIAAPAFSEVRDHQPKLIIPWAERSFVEKRQARLRGVREGDYPIV